MYCISRPISEERLNGIRGGGNVSGAAGACGDTSTTTGDRTWLCVSLWGIGSCCAGRFGLRGPNGKNHLTSKQGRTILENPNPFSGGPQGRVSSKRSRTTPAY